MKYLLDVNVLVALGIVEHEFHDQVTTWVRSLRSRRNVTLLTCSITELGFVRVLAQTQLYGFTAPTARALLLRMKAEDPALFVFLADDNDISHMPGWVRQPKQVTDGHLIQLAKRYGATFATLDGKIPGAFRVPGRG
jgi:predicted nucleic acid-binding protein